MRSFIIALLLICSLTSCTVIKRNFRSGYYISFSETNRISNRSSVADYSDVPDQVGNISPIQNQPGNAFGSEMIVDSFRADYFRKCIEPDSGIILISAIEFQNDSVQCVSPSENERTVAAAEDRALKDEEQKLKWWEILLLAIILAIGISCFAAIIIAGAATPLLVGILLIIPGALLFGGSGVGGLAFAASWGLFYIGVSPFKDDFSNDGLILYGCISLLLAFVIGFLVEEWNANKKKPVAD